MYKKGKRYCNSVLIKEQELNELIKKIYKIKSKICMDIIDKLIDKIIVKKNDNKKTNYDIYIFSRNNKKIKIIYLL